MRLLMLAGGGALRGFNWHHSGWCAVQQAQRIHPSGKVSTGDALRKQCLALCVCQPPYAALSAYQ